MTINKMFDELENKIRDTYIVTLKYKYDFEKNYTIENHILEYESITDSYVWLNDWYEGQTDVEVLGYMLLGDVDTTKLLTCDDCISREEVIEALRTWIQYGHLPNGDYVPLDYLSNPEEYVAFVRFEDAETCINEMPSVTPKFTDEEIQKMQELEQAQLDKAYELGKAEMQTSFEDWLSTFNTDSATECFTAVQELKKRLEGENGI